MSTTSDQSRKNAEASYDIDNSELKEIADELEKNSNAEKFFIGKSFVEDVYNKKDK